MRTAPFALWIDTPNFASMSLSCCKTVIAGAALALLLTPAVRAQVMPIAWTLHIAPGLVHQGQPFTALVRAQIPYGWHLYSTTQPTGGPNATTFRVNGTTFAMQGKVGAREPDRAFDATAGMKTETYSDSVTFRVPVVASRKGRQPLELRVKYQSCTDRFCTPEQIVTVKATVSVTPPASGKR